MELFFLFFHSAALVCVVISDRSEVKESYKVIVASSMNIFSRSRSLTTIAHFSIQFKIILQYVSLDITLCVCVLFFLLVCERLNFSPSLSAAVAAGDGW
jgi:hypothetical protein